MVCSATPTILDNMPALIVIGILLAFLLFVILSFLFTRKRGDKYRRLLEEQSNSVRIFTIDIPNNKVTFFNVTTLSNAREYTLGEFYQQFPIFEQKKVINWINALAEPGTSAPEFLETDIQESRSKRQYFSLLQVEKVDQERQVIHLQSYLMKYMASSSGSTKHGLSTMKEYQAAISNHSKRRGATAVYRFSYKRISDADEEIDPIVFNQFKNALYPLVSGKRMLLKCSGNELLLADFRVSDRANALYLFRTGLNAINRYLSLNGYLSQIEVRVGVVEHRLLSGDADSIIEQARKTAVLAHEGNDALLLFEKGKEHYVPTGDSTYRTEVERIINERKISYLFRPIFNVKNGKTLGYFAKGKPKDTYFDSMEELKDYAFRTEDDRALFSTLARETTHLFLAERPDETQSLFFPVRLEERGYMLTTFGKLPNVKSAHVVFLFSEADFYKKFDSSDPDSFANDMVSIRAKGYEVGLFLNSGSLQLPASVYGGFDYFVCDLGAAGTAREMDALVRSQLHAMVEKLLRFHKPIIATNIEGWPAVELVVRSGMSLISADVLAPYDVMMNPVPAKTIKRIKEMKD